MANIAKVLKDELQRIARREISRATVPLKKSNALLRRIAYEQKQKIAVLEKEHKKLQQMASASPASTSPPAADVLITGRGIRSLRRRLRITQEEFAKLIGSSVQIVPRWEKKRGRFTLRNPRWVEAILRLQSMKKADVQLLLGHEAAGKKSSAGPPKARAGNYVSSITAAMIKAARTRLGLSQAAFAKRLGMSNQIVSKWESRGGRLVLRDRSTEKKIAEVLRQ